MSAESFESVKMLSGKHFFVLALGVTSFASGAFAGVFSSIHYVDAQKFSLGIEPELVFSEPAGVAANFRYNHGLSEFLNAGLLLGTGGGSRGFRVGGNVLAEFFPDVDAQPALGVSLQMLYVRASALGQLELSVAPYVRKTFHAGSNQFQPYVAVPFGTAFRGGEYRGISTFVVGSQFKLSAQVSALAEMGVALSNTDTYLSGGVLYYY
jgi:hypothetical protein